MIKTSSLFHYNSIPMKQLKCEAKERILPGDSGVLSTKIFFPLLVPLNSLKFSPIIDFPIPKLLIVFGVSSAVLTEMHSEKKTWFSVGKT